MQMISHGFVSRRDVPLHRRDVRPPAQSQYCGLWRRGQCHAKVRRVVDAVRHGNAGLPGTPGFIGEFTVTLAAVKQGMFWTAACAGLALILGAATPCGCTSP